MIVDQLRWTLKSGWDKAFTDVRCPDPDIVLIFGSDAKLQNPRHTDKLREAYPRAHHLGCSTAGEIYDTLVDDDSVVVTAIKFEHSRVAGGSLKIENASESFAAGAALAGLLDPRELAHVFVLSDGLSVNGSDLVHGLSQQLPPGVSITGGLAGDGPRFGKTSVLWNGAPERNSVAVLGFYGSRLRVGYGSLGGWDQFGPERIITKSSGNVLYELDGKSALELYKRYLGDQAAGLPGSGLLFPLAVRANYDETAVVRTILAVNEDTQSLTFAGDIPQGSYARLMRANFDRLIDGAMGAAKTSIQASVSDSPDLAILISCVGRKMVLGQRVEEEVEGVREILGHRTVMTGFYSYGEISPFTSNARCELHNQTMTITTLTEI